MANPVVQGQQQAHQYQRPRQQGGQADFCPLRQQLAGSTQRNGQGSKAEQHGG
ncbi:hypothetical protein D3C77_719080 [compost metagenome]